MLDRKFRFHQSFVRLLFGFIVASSFVVAPRDLQAANAIWYVNANASGTNSGSSWANAFTDLQSALAVAQATDQIWIAKGVYRPTSDLSNLTSARTISFEIPNGVALYGGFAGGESTLPARDWQLNQTVLSGDLQQNDTNTNGVILNTADVVGTNSRNVVRMSIVDASTVLDGLIITGGQVLASDTPPYNNGAGLNLLNASPTINNLFFSANSAAFGGAIYISNTKFA